MFAFAISRSLPSEYLHPLADFFPDRSLVFYDQLGCGQSSTPENMKLYSFERSIDDLEVIVKSLRLRRFHIYGHSFGGSLAYEYVKRIAERIGREEDNWQSSPEVLSIIISNTATSVKLSNEEQQRLFDSLRVANTNHSNSKTLNEVFWEIHQCRVVDTPKPLSKAIANWGKNWYEASPVMRYTANPPSRWAVDLPPLLVIRGEYDFITEACTYGWKCLFNHDNVQENVMQGCSHYCHLEAGKEYGHLMQTFCSEQDP